MVELQEINDDELWELALANPVPLFRTLENDPLVAVFDDKGFFLSDEAKEEYQKMEAEYHTTHHIYTARFKSNDDAIYFGKSRQKYGRWKPQHAYHLGGLAYEILCIKRYDDQNHSHWVKSWFEKENFQPKKDDDSMYHIRMRQNVVISVYVPEPEAPDPELKAAEGRLIQLARSKGLSVLNKKIDC
jgi:hypothetical protein